MIASMPQSGSFLRVMRILLPTIFRSRAWYSPSSVSRLILSLSCKKGVELVDLLHELISRHVARALLTRCLLWRRHVAFGTRCECGALRISRLEDQSSGSGLRASEQP